MERSTSRGQMGEGHGSETSAAAAERLLAALNSTDPDAIRQALAPDFVFEDVAGAGERSASALIEEARMIRGGLPDIEFRRVRQSPIDGRTVIEFRGIGTHLGEFLSVPATGTLCLVSGAINVRGEGDLVSRLRLTIDFGGLRRQLLMAHRAAAS